MKRKSIVDIIIFLLYFIVLSETQTPQGKIILDVDAGADDAFGIILAVRNAELLFGDPLIAITCVNGGSNLKNVETNVLKTLQQLQRPDIPVYIGASESLVYTPPVDDIFRNDGFGDIPFDRNFSAKSQNEHAVVALIRLVNENPGEIILIALGPLTNIALAIKMDTEFVGKLKDMVILGGAIAGIGNVRPGIEFNSFMDPEAFAIVLQASTFNKVTLLPWDTIYRSNLETDWRRNLASIGSKDLEFINIAGNKTLLASPHWHFGGPMAVAVYIWPETMSSGNLYRTAAVTCGEARGGLLVDFFRADQNVTTSNVKIITGFGAETFREYTELLFQLLAGVRFGR